MWKKNPITFLVMKGWQYAGRYRPYMFAYLFMFIIAQCIALFEPYVIGRMLNAVQADVTAGSAKTQEMFNDICVALGLFFAIQFGFWSFHGPGRLIERYCAFHIKANYKASLFKALTRLPLKWHREHHSGESIDKIKRATDSLAMYFDETFEIIYMTFRLLGTFVILFMTLPFAGWSALITTALALTTIAVFDRVLSTQYKQLNKSENYVASALHDYVTNIVSVITLRLENRTLHEVKRRIHLPLPLYKRNGYINEFKWFLTNMLIGAMIVFVLIVYAHDQVSAGKALMAGTFFTLFEYLRRIGDSFYQFAGIYGLIVRQAADVRGADTIHEAHAKEARVASDARLPANWQKLEIRNLNFTYEDDAKRTHHLRNVALDLEKGKAIAFVGESGSGKSTTLTLLRGLQSAAQVEVFVDGQRLEENLRHLAHHTTLMPQDPEIFSDTIRFNITFGMEANDDEIMEAARLARFDGVLRRLEKGLDTNIAEKGVNLSGGEKQRLALARGIYFGRGSDLVLMDEPTSSVDTFNERLIYTSLLKRYRSRCLISSIHKLHLLELFDYIYVFEDGEVIESGDFATLLTQGGALAKMWRNYQATQSIDGDAAMPDVVADATEMVPA